MKNSLRILLITWNFPPKIGGMETMLSELASHLKTNAEVHVFAPKCDSEVESGLDYSVTRSRWPGLVGYFIDAFLYCFRLLRSDHFDLVVAGSSLTAPIVYFIGRLTNTKTVVNVYGLDLIHPHHIYQLMVRAFLPHFDKVIAISHQAKVAAIERGAAPSKITIVNPGVRFSEFCAEPDVKRIRAKYSANGRVILLSVGRLARRKGVAEFIEHALPRIVTSCQDVMFLVVGDNPQQSLAHKDNVEARIVEIIDRLGLAAYVSLLGRLSRNDLVELFHACDIFLLPAIPVEGDMEGFGIVLIEAAAAGKPVISTSVGGIPDAVIDGMTGLLVQPEAWDEFADAVLHLIEDKSKRQQFGQASRQRAKNELDWEVVSKHYRSALEAVINGSS